MYLSRLTISRLRNLNRVDIQPGPQLNLITGENGSGKSSLLEAIHLLGLGRSFRTRQSRQIISDGENELTLFGHLQSNTSHRIGLRRTHTDAITLQVDGRRLKSSSALASLMPLQIITPESHELVTGSPKLRRSFIDWSLFHVEHHFHSNWFRYARALKQRNGALRTRRPVSEIAVWDVELIETGETIDRLRRAYVSKLEKFVPSFLQRMAGLSRLEFRFRSGWSRDHSLAEAIKHQTQRDMNQGFTSVGPHRADLKILVDGHDVVTHLSRGQQKLLVCALKLAQASLLKQETDKSSLLLIDDLAAELDEKRRVRLLDLMSEMEMQSFVTSTDISLIPDEPLMDRKVFHVEHGVVSEVV